MPTGAAIDKSKIPLRRVIGLPTGILLVAGLMIGSGVYKKIAPMSATLMNESYILLAWIIAGCIALIGALMLSGFATLTTDSGGIYEYLRLSTGPFFSFLYGWTLFTIIGSGAVAALAFIFSQSVNTLVHIADPLHQIANVSIGNTIFPFASSGIKMIAIAAIGLLTWINYRGTKNGAMVNNIVTGAKILGIAFLIVMGFFYSNARLVNIVNANNSPQFSNAAFFSALFGAMLSAFWAYDGWYSLTCATGEIKNPRKNVPIALIAGVLIAMALYVLLNYSYMRVLPLNALAAVGDNDIAAAAVAQKLLGHPGTVILSILIAISTFSALNACILFYPRVYLRMAEEDFFFKKVANIHPIFRTPYVSLFLSMIWSGLLVLSGTFDLLTNLVIFASFLFYILLAIGQIRMKAKKLIETKLIGYPVVPMIIILFSGILIVNTLIVQMKQSIIGLFLVLSGVPVYYYFKRRNSLKSEENQTGDTG